ncbi:MAG: Rieske 2Fe-2S domain-containing protein [Geobacter sp.]|nr:Rieske 2Fe-2S domain-containing protein [Geobacter sp.]
MADVRQSRRRFLVALTAGIAALAGLGRFLRPRKVPQREILSAPLADIPADSALVFREERVAVVRSESGYYALSLVCTHLGCTVSVGASGLFCPCHGSVFDREGRVVKGPATRPLPRLTVAVRGDRLVVSG